MIAISVSSLLITKARPAVAVPAAVTRGVEWSRCLINCQAEQSSHRRSFADVQSDRKATLSKIVEGGADRSSAKRTLQVSMAHLWSRVLGTGPVGLADDFFLLNPAAR